jgi:hypothetical protein
METNEEARAFINNARSKNQISGTDSLGLLMLISIGLSGASLLGTVLLFFSYLGVANKPMPALVQLATGKTIKVATMDEKERTPQVIKDFVSLTMVRMMSWSGALPPETPEDLQNPKPDPGVKIPVKDGQQVKVPTIAWRSSFALSSDLQNPFLQELAKLATKMLGQNMSQAQTRLEILNVGEPIQIQKGAWRIPIIANITVLNRTNPLPERVAFNKDVLVRTIPVPAILESGSPAEKTLSQLIAEGKANGIEIYAITEPKNDEILPNDPTQIPSSKEKKTELTPDKVPIQGKAK